jgi:hypothetical protein
LFKANKYRDQLLGTYHIMQLLREAAAGQRKNKNTEVIGCKTFGRSAVGKNCALI